ncbi:MAG: TadE/TadG family type IV pilus assembly protein [Aeromicrobium sp.]
MYASRERGAAAVEFALIVPLLVLVIFGVVEGGTRYSQQSQVNHWANMTARDLSIDPTKSATTLVNALKGSDTHTFTVSVSPASLCTSTANNQVTVTITSARTSPSGMFGSYTIKGKGVARCEN